MATIGNLVVNLMGNANPLRATLQQASGMLSGFAARIGTVLGAGMSLQAATEDIAAMRKLEAVLAATGGAAGLSADEIATMASELQKVTNYGDEVTVSAAAILATFKEIKGDTFRQAIEAAQDLSAVMGQDLQSSVVQIGKALNDPERGFTALRKVGVSFTEQQEEMIKAMMKAGDVAGAQKVILKELQSEFGGAAKAMADPVTQLKNAIGDVGEEIGKVILPFVKQLADVAIPFFQKWGSTIATVTVALFAVVAALKAVALGQAMALALAGPKGWAALAIGLGVAYASASALKEAFTSITGEADEAYAKSVQMTAALSDETPIAVTKKKVDIAKELAKALEDAHAEAMKLQGVSDTDMKLGKLFGDGAGGKDLAELEKVMRENDKATALKSYGDAMRDLVGRINDVKNGTVELGQKMREFAGTGFIDQEMIDRFQQLNKTLSDMNAAKSLEESLMTPLEKASEELRKIEDLRRQGMLTDETYKRAKDKVNKDLASATKTTLGQAGAAVQGSREAYATIAKNMSMRQNSKLEKLAEKQLEETKKTNSKLDKSGGAGGGNVVLFGGSIPS